MKAWISSMLSSRSWRSTTVSSIGRPSNGLDHVLMGTWSFLVEIRAHLKAGATTDVRTFMADSFE